MTERQQFIDLFLEINSQINLSAIRDVDWVYTKHILDSLELTKIVDLSDYTTLCDVGTGGGLPLLALSRYNQENNCRIKLYGIDARRKKIDAITTMIDQLWIKNCTALWSRSEDHHHQYDIVTARAVAYADHIIARSLPLCKKNGYICLYKQSDPIERSEIIKQCKQHSLVLQQEHHYSLFAWDIQRVIYILHKQ